MAKLELKFRGRPTSQTSASDQLDYFEEVQTYEVHSSTRSDVPEVPPISLSEEDLIQLKLSDETFWIGDKDTLEELFPQKLQRSGNQNELYLPDFLETESQDRNAVKRIGIKLFSIFKKKKESVQIGMRHLAEKVENKQLSVPGIEFENEGAGLLCHCDPDFTLSRKGSRAIGKKVLLFLHGTGSSSAGSFAELYGKGKNQTWETIYNSYGQGNVMAFQHRTLTQSPLDNVLELVRQLPASVELDLITHSRGGLVGDVLVRFSADPKGFDETERGVLEMADRKDLEVIKAIQKEIADKQIKVRNMVRVACPANGTTLASKRMDFLLNILMNLVGTLSGQATNPVFQAFRELVMTAVNSKNNPDSLPGLESMNPESPFIKVLNFQGTSIQIDSLLHVVGGSSELSLEFKGLVVLAGKLFFRGQNDLVVDTESMKWGTPRPEGKASYYIDSSKKINHIVYFGTPETQEKIFLGLQENVATTRGGFQVIQRAKKSDLDRGVFGIEGGKTKREKVTGKRPILLLLPGIMGSNLTVNDDMVWINYARFLTGQLSRLKNDPKNNPHVKAHSLVKTSYGKLADYLGKTYDVVTFPFDWRMPLPDSAKFFRDKVEELMEFGQPIKIVAHSMGGVLVRDFMLHHEETWKKLNSSSGFRVLFLGSPLGGSYRIPFVLFGQDDIIKLLAKIDISNSVEDLLSVFSQLPGLLNLLPIKTEEGQPDFSDSKTWLAMRKAFGREDWPVPSEEVLAGFGEYQKKVVQQSKLIDYSNCYYIAGQSRKDKLTISSFEIQENGRKLQFFGTREGDESVTWETGIPAQIHSLQQLYYANVTHGGLSNQPSIFGAIEEILDSGRASSLANQLPKLRSAEDQKLEPKIEEIFDLSEENVENTLLGITAVSAEEEGELPIKVTVSHGDLKFSQYPVLAGHFELDAILTTEEVIDRQLDGELSKLQELGLYPGAIGTNQVILSKNDKGFKGAVIIGLGTPGELSSFQLMNSVEKGISRYLTLLNYQDKECPPEQNLPAGISVIAIANSYGGLSSDTSIRAILLGIQRANRKIRTIYKSKLKTIEEVEIIEIYHDKALSILKTVKGLQEDNSGEFKVSLKKKALEQSPGRRHRIPYENSSDWWTRITVSQEEKSNSGRNRVKMALATSGASQKVEYLKVNTKNLETLLREMTEENRARPEIAKTMFELLVPQDFKEELKRQSNISWVVDETTAAFPWEMLQEDIQAKPLAIYSGMVRQLATEDYRKISNKVQGNQVLVVGDPKLDDFLPQLPQARKEGELVAEFLQGKGFSVKKEIHTSASRILLELFSQDYKIIHLAAHGIYSDDPESPAGVVIGKDAFISVQEIAQMSTVPDLVFVNCCYLGKMDLETKSSRQDRNRLAANIGTQLIRNGVKAVVVAGWAVDDQAALDFCQKFYQELFSGVRFGEAVRRARQHIYNSSKDHTNTWGAYQCYGDPFYELKDYRDWGSQAREFLVKEEAELELVNLVQLMESKGADNEYASKKIEELERALKKADVRSEKITELFAELYAKIGDYEKAIPYYTELFSAERADFSFRSMEQLCNISCKRAVQVFFAGKQSSEELKTALAEIDQNIQRLRGLIGFGVTSERMSLLGSALKRKLMVIPSTRVKELENTLAEAGEAYREASVITNHQDYYPLVNWVQLVKLQSLLSKSGRMAESKTRFMELLEACEKEEKMKSAGASDPWAFFGLANIALAKWILEDGKGSIKPVLQAFVNVLNRVGASGHLKAQFEHSDFLLKCLEASDRATAKKIKSKVEEMKAGFEQLQ
ncbi:DUF7379 domain-containing protein [Algoriphagus mannitolivorans]|uniref:DUF7379 domain-containing protein n=1 Tax=Algoriphagus mannitolivorans TaxID=226504 RepID=UPI00042A0025|nr:CHAT domain-containing protein [Algoriphagus mannitolivorans]